MRRASPSRQGRAATSSIVELVVCGIVSGAMRAAGLIDLHNDRAVNRIVEFAEVAAALASDVGSLALRYEDLVRVAPRRHDRGKRYLHGHTGITSSGPLSNRREEHLAVALYNASSGGEACLLPDQSQLEIIDYQMPLKARRDDRGIGKVDLFAVVDGRLPCVVELKVARESARGDTPLRALLEGLAYCAIIEANAADIASEVEQHPLAPSQPILIVMAPDDYWTGYLNHPKAGRWFSAVRDLATGLRDTLGLEIYLLALLDASFEMGLGGQPPRLIGSCQLVSVDELLISGSRG